LEAAYRNLHCAYENWHALFVYTGREDYIKRQIENRLAYDKFGDLRLIVPKRKLRERKAGIWTDVVKTLFPGYILVNSNENNEWSSRLKDVNGIVRFLRDGQELAKIERSEIEVINRLIINDDLIGYSTVLAEGSTVKVIEGPLLSMEGYIQSIDTRKGRAKVVLNFLGEQRTVDLGINIIRSVL
jgi:transcriptional antiterminator NusG